MEVLTDCPLKLALHVIV